MFLLRVDVVNAMLQVTHSPKPRACCFPKPPRRIGIGACGRADRTADFICAAQKIDLRTALATRRLQSLVWDNTAMGGEVRDLSARWQGTSRWSTQTSIERQASRHDSGLGIPRSRGVQHPDCKLNHFANPRVSISCHANSSLCRRDVRAGMRLALGGVFHMSRQQFPAFIVAWDS